MIFFGPHHEGRAACAEEVATKLVATVSAATAIALATLVIGDFKRIKLFPFLDVRHPLTHFRLYFKAENFFRSAAIAFLVFEEQNLPISN